MFQVEKLAAPTCHNNNLLEDSQLAENPQNNEASDGSGAGLNRPPPSQVELTGGPGVG